MGDDGPQYVYIRVADAIERDIRRGAWPFGAKLPGRRRLGERLGVAELTVRRALRVLEKRGVVRILPSSGVYVTWTGRKEGP